MPLNRARVRRSVTEFVTGAVLGGLAFLAARTLGLPGIFGWNGFEALPAFVLVGALLYLTTLRSLLWGVAGVLVVVVAIAALTPASVRPARALIRVDADTAAIDAVAVLSAELSDDALINPDGVDRLLTGLALARAHRRDDQPNGLPVVLTVVTRSRNPAISSTGDQQRIIELAGGGVDAHWTAPVHSTRDEARAVAALARTEGWSRVAVVTSPLHSRRACATFERAGLAIRCVPSEARNVAVNTLRSSRDRMRVTQLWIYEMAGTVYYKLRGWI